MKHFLLFTLSLLFFWQTGFSQSTFFVSPPPTGDDSNDGSEDFPFATIQKAITDANADDIIKVNPGAYSDAFSVNKSVIIEGIGEGTEQVPLAVTISNTFDINASNVVLQNLLLNNDVTIVSGSNNVSLFNSTILGTITVNSGVSGFTLNESDLSGAPTPAILNSSGNTVDASYNWWGSAEKADFIGKIDPATVAYSPWLNSGDDTSLLVGFQPDLSSVSVDGSGDGDLQSAADSLSANSTINIVEGNYTSLVVNKSLIIAISDGQTQINDLEIDASNVEEDTLTIDGSLLVLNSLSLDNGNIKTADGGQVTLGDNIRTTNESNGRLVGNFATTPRTITPQQSFSILGLSIQGSNRANPLSNVVVQRISGNSGIVEENESQSIKSRWIINADQEPTGRELIFSWHPSFDNPTSDFDEASVVVWRLPDDSDTWEPVTDSLGVSILNDLRLVTVPANSVSGFSSWTVSDINEPLPVTLVDFTAQLDEASVRLDWATATETNAHFFGIERSTDGLFFEEIARNQAVGESNSLRNYLYIDEGIANRLTGILYYRLRMVDFDESFEYSNIVAVSLSGDDDLRVYADASAGTLKLFTQQLPAGDYLVQVSDMLGNVLIESSLTTSDQNPIFAFPLSSPARSVYVVRCFGAQALYTQKFRLE